MIATFSSWWRSSAAATTSAHVWCRRNEWPVGNCRLSTARWGHGGEAVAGRQHYGTWSERFVSFIPLVHKMSDSKPKTDQTTQHPDHKHSQDGGGHGAGSDTAAPPVAARAVLTTKEVGRMVDLGLGRGVDATSPRPWLNKTPFQVRRVAFEGLIGTEEGGSMMSYESSVSSVMSQQSSLKASIAVPRSPVTVGVDAELSRGTNTTRRAIGKRVVNRTVSFRDDFEEVPVASTPEEAVREASAVSTRTLYTAGPGKDSDERVADAASGTTFQERLARWIIDRILHRRRMADLELGVAGKGKPAPGRQEEVACTGDPVNDLAEFIHKSTADERRLIVRDCHDFVSHFRITHYVSSIQLGASEYRVMNENEYFTQVTTVGSLGLDALTNFALTEKYSKKVTTKASERRTIGVISKSGTVERGSYNEAVVGVSFQPITSLLTLRYLYLATRKALLDYMEDQGDASSKCSSSHLPRLPPVPPCVCVS